MPLGWSLELTELGLVKREENKDYWKSLFERFEEPDADGSLPLFNNLFSLILEWLRWQENGELVDGRRTFTEKCIEKFMNDVFISIGDKLAGYYREVLHRIVGMYIWRF